MSKISELSNGGALLSTDDLIVVRSGGNVRAQLSSLNGIAIGSSTPAAGSFTTLQASTSLNVDGSVTADDLIKVQNAAGSAAAEVDIVSGGTWRIRSNPTSGTNSYGFDIIKGSAGTDVKMSIDSSGNTNFNGSVTADGLTVGSSSVVADVTTGGSTPFFKVKRGTTNQANLVASLYNDNDAGIDVHGNGDISFYEDTGTTPKFFWDASAESLGIGTSSVVSPLTTSIGAGSAGSLNNQISMTHSGASTAFHLKTIRASANDEPDGLAFIQNTSEAMRITSGNVGIGTSSLASGDKLTVAGRTKINSLYVGEVSANYDLIQSTSSAGLRLISTGGSAYLDSGGNLLVGGTSTTPHTNTTTPSTAFMADGQIRSAANGEAVVELNRTVSDGDIAVFRKSGSTVGSIAVQSGQIEINGNPSAATTVRFGTTATIYPNTDAVGDLGADTRRFKDLYLSGRARAAGSTGFPAFAHVTDTDTGMNPDGAGNIQFSTQGIEAMRIDSSQNFIVGNTSAGAASAVTLRADGVIIAPEVYSTAVSASLRDLQIDSSGFFGYSTSTRATKDNIEPLTDVSWLLDLEPVSFNRKITETEVSTETEYGLVADDVESVNANICFYDETENGKELVGITYSKLITPILKLVQEQQTLIETLTDRIAALEQ